jgi:hypothetical protein
MRGCRARFESTLAYFDEYPTTYLGLNLQPVRDNVRMWLGRLDTTAPGERLRYVDADVPVLRLEKAANNGGGGL